MPIRSLVAALLALVASGRSLAAQTGGEPKWFATAGTGLQWGVFVVDDASGSTWDFDMGFTGRGTLERVLSPRFTAGVAFNYARLPLTWSATGTGASPAGCTRCAADATVSSWGVTTRYAEPSRTLHQVVELFAGVLRYGNFTRTGSGAPLPLTSNVDGAFGAGYGLGVAFSRDWQLTLMQEALYAVHERSSSGLAGGRIAQHYTTRLGLRVGF